MGQTSRPGGILGRDVHVPLFAVFYAAALLALVTVKPLWLDEIIELYVTSGPGWSATLQHIAQTPGGSPLGYAGQYLLRSVGTTAIWASRLPSLIAAIASLVAFLFLCRRLIGRRTAILAGILWCICPLALRYSLEGRPYMQGVLFAILAVLAQLRLSESVSVPRFCALAGCLAAAIYSQPFALFAPLVFSVWDAARRRDRQYAGVTAAAYALAALSFLPWFLAARHYWSESILPNRGNFHLNGYLFLTLLRECAGDGYPAAIPAILAAVYSSARYAWVVVLGAVALALAADARFHYFYATRQIIYVLPFLLIMVADGLVTLWEHRRHRPAAVVLAAVFVTAALAKDYRHLADHSEDWARLSSAIAHAVEGGCILTPTRDEVPLYSVIDPELSRSLCNSSVANRVVVPFTTYTGPERRRDVEERLKANGLHEVSSTDAGFATVKVFVRIAPGP